MEPEAACFHVVRLFVHVAPSVCVCVCVCVCVHMCMHMCSGLSRRCELNNFVQAEKPP